MCTTTTLSSVVHDFSRSHQVYPVVQNGLWKMYKQMQQLHWVAEEIQFTPQDRVDFEALSPGERHYVESVLSFFAGFDAVVLENLDANFAAEVGLPEARCFFAMQEANEAVHAEVYALLIDTLVREPERKNRLLAGLNASQVAGKRNFARSRLDPARPFGERLLAAAVIEGILFSSSFCGIFWLRKRNLLPAVCLANDFISRDEGLHVDFACALFALLTPEERPSSEVIAAIVEEGVAVEQNFVEESLPSALVGLNAESVCRYVRFCADRLLEQLGEPARFGDANPFPWMDAQGVQTKSNFFERRESQYASVSAAEDAIGFDDTF